jgi:hypothetical protein
MLQKEEITGIHKYSFIRLYHALEKHKQQDDFHDTVIHKLTRLLILLLSILCIASGI